MKKNKKIGLKITLSIENKGIMKIDTYINTRSIDSHRYFFYINFIVKFYIKYCNFMEFSEKRLKGWIKEVYCKDTIKRNVKKLVKIK